MTTVTISDLKPAEGATKGRKRVGRGRASGHGKTSCRGHNGEGQRAGLSQKLGFEGGQMPLYRRIPKKKGFTNINERHWAIINLDDIEKLGLTEVHYQILEEVRWIKKDYDGLRILGEGVVTKPVKITANHVSRSAREKIEASGGSIELI